MTTEQALERLRVAVSHLLALQTEVAHADLDLLEQAISAICALDAKMRSR